MLSINYNVQSDAHAGEPSLYKTSNPHSELWALMDCNNFYASCERLFRPDLCKRPVVVLSNNDGCIVARSAEAKALGIPMGEPEFKARALLKKHDVAVFSSNYALYGDISQRVMQAAESVVPDMEQYSIDEAFLRFSNALEANALEAAHFLRSRVLQWTGIAVSVGLAPTRTLAKLANHLAKKEQQGGVYIFPTDQDARTGILARVDVGDVWGIGRKHAAKLKAHSIFTAKDLRDAPDDWLRKTLSVTGLRTALELRGLSCIDTEHLPTPRHTLISSRSFGTRIYSKEHLAEALCTFTANAAARLRRENLLAKGIAVHIRSSKHIKQTNQSPYNKTIHINLLEAGNDSTLMLQAVLRGLDSIFKDGVAYAKAGVMLYDLCSANHRRTSLLCLNTQDKRQRNAKLMATLDAVNARYGKHKLRYAAEGIDQDAPWRMRQKFLSPKFTTAWDGLACAFCK